MPEPKPKYQEFLITLREATGTNNKQLAKLIGKKESNTSDYISGKKRIGLSGIRSAVHHLAEWNVLEDKTMLPICDKSQLSTNPGIYFIYDSAGNCVYIGQARNLRTEVNLRLKSKILRHGIWRDPKLKLTRYKIEDVAAYVTTFHVASSRLRHNLEALFLLTIINQTQNSKKGNVK